MLKKLFQKSGSADQKANSRTLAMVLDSERELMDQNRDYEAEVSELRGKVEELADLCLKQGKEIKELKDEILFPDVMNLWVLEEEERYELILSLQQQVSLLTGQIQVLAEDLAEAKAGSSRFDGPSRRIPLKQEYSPGEPLSTQHDPVEDLNPCVTSSFS